MILISLSAALLAPCSLALAAPVDYTFTGKVTSTTSTVYYNVGDSVSYTMLADTALHGTITDYSGNTFDEGAGTFYDAYLSGNLIPDSGAYNISTCPGCAASYNFGSGWTMNGGSANSSLYLTQIGSKDISALERRR